MNTNYIDHSKNIITVNILFGFAQVVLCILSKIYFSGLCSAFLIALWYLYIWKIRKSFFIKYIQVIYLTAAVIVSDVIIEYSNPYILQLQSTTHFSGSIPVLVLSSWVLYLVILYNDKDDMTFLDEISISDYSEDIKYERFVISITYLFIAINTILLLRVIKHPAFILGMDRFTYRMTFNYYAGVWGKLTALSSSAIIFPLMAIKIGYKRLGIIGIASYLIYTIWVGNKFGTIFLIISITCICFFAEIRDLIEKYRMVVFYYIIFAILLLYLASFLQSRYSLINRSMTQYLLWRSTEEGCVWWKTYDICKGIIHPNEISDEINGLINGKESIAANVGANYGPYKLMYLCAPKERIDRVLAGGSRLCGSGFAGAYYYFGMLGCLLFAVFSGFVVSKTMNAIINSIVNRRLLLCIILIRLYEMEMEMFDQFIFTSFRELSSILSYIVLIIASKKILEIKIGNKVSIDI